MSARLDKVVGHLDATLEIHRFRDYGTNGLQIEGRGEVSRVVTGVSANAALFERAVELGADLVVVHHGLIWGSGLADITGVMARRIELLMRHGISLAAYHLPLDDHPRLGNNAGLCDAIGLTGERERFGNIRGHALGVVGTWASPRSRSNAVGRIAAGMLGGEIPEEVSALPFVFAHGPDTVRKVGVCSGAASDMIEDAARAGCDLFLTGELAERAGDMARELGITLVAAGHYATEVFGPRLLADELRRQFPSIEAHFVGVPSPL